MIVKGLITSIVLHLLLFAALIDTSGRSEKAPQKWLIISSNENLPRKKPRSDRKSYSSRPIQNHKITKPTSKPNQLENHLAKSRLSSNESAKTASTDSGDLVYEPSQVDSNIRVLQTPIIHYPEAELRAGNEAEVKLSLIARRDGTVGNVSIVQGASHAFNIAAIESIQTLRFDPASLDGKLVSMHLHWLIEFRLKDHRF